LLHDNGLVEIRHLDNGRVQTGLFDSLGAIRTGTHKALGRGNLYCSLNAPKPRKATNQLLSAGPGACLANSDIEWVNRLPIDCDPVRPAKTASTDAELKAAFDVRNRLVDWLCAQGWAVPAFALSGNGYHAVFRVRLPNSPEISALLNRLYSGLQRLFQTDDVGFDTTVRNSARILRLYGTRNRKGQPTAERPHRLSNCWVPDPFERVTLGQIARLADEIAPIQPPVTRSSSPRRYAGSGGNYETLDVVSWFRAHGHYRKYIRDYQGAPMHSILCPWHGEHSTGTQGTIILESPSGWPGFKCQHSHCQGRTIADVMALWGDADAFCSADFGRAG
jgi:hypothetical protein